MEIISFSDAALGAEAVGSGTIPNARNVVTSDGIAPDLVTPDIIASNIISSDIMLP
jgi:hypothetical protein